MINSQDSSLTDFPRQYLFKLKKLLYQIFSQPSMEEDASMISKNRDFVCACGKNYLSYAALFTHIKQKHQGKAPGPIVRPRSERKRGRPRKIPAPGSENKYSDSDFINNSNGFQIPNQINNSFEHSKKKTQQAAQILLGSGSFKSFQKYQPEGKIIPFKRTVSQSHVKIHENFEAKIENSSPQITNLKALQSKNIEKYEPFIANHLQSHNKILCQIFSNFEFNLELIKSYLKQNDYFNTIKAAKNGLLCSSIASYLDYIKNLIASNQHIIVKYVLSLFISFISQILCGSESERILEITLDEGLKHTNQFIQKLKSQRSVFVSNKHRNTNNISTQVDQADNIDSQFSMQIIMLYTYWVSVFTDYEHETLSQHVQLGRRSPKSICEPKKKQMIKDQTELVKNNSKVLKRRRQEPVVINNIQDILKGIQYNNQMSQEQDQAQQQEPRLPNESAIKSQIDQNILHEC